VTAARCGFGELHQWGDQDDTEAQLVAYRSDEYPGFGVGTFSCPFCHGLHQVDVTVRDGEVIPPHLPAPCCGTWVQLMTAW